VGAINLAGQTPIILVNDGPSGGGFINPYTVPQCAFWKLGQSRPGESYRFRVISVDEAQAQAREMTQRCTPDSLE
jgi:urea carboxylase